MALNFNEQTSPTATNMDKTVHAKVVRLVASDFVTGGVASVKAVIPADASILQINYYKKTQLSGGGITAATLSIGVTGTPTNYVNAFDVFTPVTGAGGFVSPATNLMNGLSLPLGSDVSLLFTGTATTGNPTAGEIEIVIVFVR